MYVVFLFFNSLENYCLASELSVSGKLLLHKMLFRICQEAESP